VAESNPGHWSSPGISQRHPAVVMRSTVVIASARASDEEMFITVRFRDQPPDAGPSASEHQTEPEEPFLDVIHRTHGTRAVPVILRAWIFGSLGASGAIAPSAG